MSSDVSIFNFYGSDAMKDNTSNFNATLQEIKAISNYCNGKSK